MQLSVNKFSEKPPTLKADGRRELVNAVDKFSMLNVFVEIVVGVRLSGVTPNVGHQKSKGNTDNLGAPVFRVRHQFKHS